MPASRAALISAKRGSTPGLNTIVSHLSIQSLIKPPVLTNTSGSLFFNVVNSGGCSRVSIMATA